MNRRQLFQAAAAATAARHAFSAPASATGRPATEVARDEDFWAAVRDEFTTDRAVINLNNGHVSPAPRTVQEAMRRYLDYSNMGPYHTMIQELTPRVASARRMVADLAGVGEDEIALTRNSSEALEIAQLGISLKPGD
jgi:isopenicillin-N epimerase